MASLPLFVYFVYHPMSEMAAGVAEYLHQVLNDDAAVHGIRVPTMFVPDDGTGQVPEDALFPVEVARCTIVLLADDHMAANARKHGAGTRSWGDYVVQLFQRCAGNPAHRFFPVQLSEHACPIDRRLSDLNFLRAWTIGGEHDRKTFIARRLLHLLCRQLQHRDAADESSPITVFVSHTKLDIDREPKVVRAILATLTAEQPAKTWFDTGDIEAGSRFEVEIEKGVEDAALIAVLTDSYASRTWCRKEVLLAKKHRRPVIVVDALTDREARSFPYVGNVPVLRWRDNPQDAVDLLLRETLRQLHAHATLVACARHTDDVLPNYPELVTVVGRSTERTILYPDPPLSSEEVEILNRCGVRFETPLERYAKDVVSVPGMTVALSVSEAEDCSRYGLRRQHLEAAYTELSRYLLLARVRLAYGGHLQAGGYTTRLINLLQEPVISTNRHPKHQVNDDFQSPEDGSPILSYIGWPIPLPVHEQARLSMHVDFVRIPRPAGIDENLDPLFVPEPDTIFGPDTPERRYAWAHGMTDMRTRQTFDTHARIVVGGKLGPGPCGSGTWYNSRVPGVLEEIMLSLRSKQPLYLLGAFGGCARLVIDVLQGRKRVELSWEYQRHAPHAVEMRAFYERNGEWYGYEEMEATLLGQGFDLLNNGLTADENLELATSRSVERCIELILKGLAVVSARLKNMSGAPSDSL